VYGIKILLSERVLVSEQSIKQSNVHWSMPLAHTLHQHL